MNESNASVVVVGGGLAGLSATITLLEKGASVILIDSEKDLGGNSAKASSGINGCNTVLQRKMGIDDSIDLCVADTMKAGDNENKEDLVRVLAEKSSNAIDWLVRNDVPLADINILGGHSVPRTHWLLSPKEGKPLPVGVAIIRALKAKLTGMVTNDLYKPKYQVLLRHRVDKVNYENGRIVSISVKNEEKPDEVAENIKTDNVILSSGGFSASKSLLSKYAPEKLDYPTTNGAFARGDGVEMGREIGAKLIHMNHVQLHPTAFIDPKDPRANTKFLAAEALRGSGALLLNEKGNRFANELGRRDQTTDQILKSCAKSEDSNAHVAFLVMNEAAVTKFGWPAFNFYWKIKHFFEDYKDAASFADAVNIDKLTLVNTLTSYSDRASSNEPDPFGKRVIPAQFTEYETLYVARVTPALHYSMGGLEIDTEARVLDQQSKPIQGLFAAGEVSGGVHGTNRLGGNSLLECVVFGITAAETVASDLKLADTLERNEL